MLTIEAVDVLALEAPVVNIDSSFIQISNVTGFSSISLEHVRLRFTSSLFFDLDTHDPCLHFCVCLLYLVEFVDGCHYSVYKSYSQLEWWCMWNRKML